jgi:hypothetical protein
LEVLKYWYRVDSTHRDIDDHCFNAPYLPPITLLARAEHLEQLDRLRLVPGLLHLVQHRLRSCDQVSVAVTPTGNSDPAEPIGERPSSRIVLVGVRSRALVHLAKQAARASTATERLATGQAENPIWLQLGTQFFGTLDHESASGGGRSDDRFLDAVGKLLLCTWRTGGVKATGQLTTEADWLDSRLCPTDFAEHTALGAQRIVFPFSAASSDATAIIWNTFFMLPTVEDDDTMRALRLLAQALARSGLRSCAHLLALEPLTREPALDTLEAFHSISWSTDPASEDQSVVGEMLSGADLVITAPAKSCYAVLSSLRPLTHATVAVLLHNAIRLSDGDANRGSVIALRQSREVADYLLLLGEHFEHEALDAGWPPGTIQSLPNRLEPTEEFVTGLRVWLDAITPTRRPSH